MTESQPMEVVLETEDYQNFRVRLLPKAEPSPGAALSASRILHVGSRDAKVSSAGFAAEEPPPAALPQA